MLEDGKYYCNFRGDPLGPMDERTPGIFLDQYGCLYHPDGIQWDHVRGSTGNIDLATRSDRLRAIARGDHLPTGGR